MTWFIVRIVISTVMIAAVSEVAQRLPRMRNAFESVNRELPRAGPV